MASPTNNPFVSDGSQSPPHFPEVDDTVNYSQFQREPSLPTGDLFFLSIMSPLSWVDDVGEQSFIHNPEDGVYTPIQSSTPLHITGDNVSDGHRTPTERNSPYSRRSRSPPHSQRESRSLKSPSRASSPTQPPNQHGTPAPVPLFDNLPCQGDSHKHILLSLQMAEASQAHWLNQERNPSLSFVQQQAAHATYIECGYSVRYYTLALHLSEDPYAE